MARLDITVTLHSRWIWEPGDGTSCCKCGDPAWLKQLRLLIQVGTEPESPTEIVLCQSCGEAAQSET